MKILKEILFKWSSRMIFVGQRIEIMPHSLLGSLHFYYLLSEGRGGDVNIAGIPLSLQ